jgi:hypothetical protein
MNKRMKVLSHEWKARFRQFSASYLLARAKAVLLVGSPKDPRSTSNSLGSFLGEKLGENGVACETVYINQCLGSDEKRAYLLRLARAYERVK